MEEHRTKRPRITRGEDDYLPGNIIEIELHNFMTFNSLKCKPGSRLNLVIGPNGSGKSSLVCAIALGLGGEPQLLGRATSIGAYVKRGEESAHIQISLRGFTGDELIIKRKIDTRNRSEWVVNGKAVTRKEVLEIIQKFNIQVNNLTQFLPQDRVCEFAKLTPVQLLEETEKAVGDPQLPIQHQTLIRKSDELKRVELAVHRNKETLDQMKALNAEQEKDVERVRQREKLLKKAELMKMKLPWLKYDLIKAEFNEAKDEEKDAKKNLDAAAKNLNDLREPIEKQKQENRRLEAKLKNVITSINDNADMRRALAGEEKELREQIRLKYKRMEDMRRQEEDRQQRILKAKEDLAAAVSELRNLPLYEPPKEEIERLGSQIAEIEISAKQKRIQKSEKERLLVQNRESLKHCMDRLREMENKNNKLLRALQRSGADRIFEAHKWLQDHQHELKNAVYGPVLLEVNVTSRDHANYLDGHIPHYIWKSFITQDPSDRDFLVKHMRMFDVPVLNYTNEKHRKVPFDPSLEMRHLGIYSRLDQVFEAPDAVKEVLISQFNLEYSYIGYKEADENAAEVFSRLGISDFWTPENHYRWSKSRYGDHVSGSVQQVSMSRLLLSSSDAGEIENLHSKKAELEESVASLEESVRSYQIEMRHLEDEAAKLHKQREEIISVAQNEKKKRRDMEQRITQKRRRLESVEKEEDVDTVIAKLIDEVVKFNNQRFHCAIKVKKLFIETLSHQRSFAEKRLSSIESDAKIRELECNIKDQEKFALQASLHYEYCKKEMDECRERLLAAKRHAESVAVITRELGRAFLEMPTTIEDLEVAIQENIHEANSILFLNQNVLKEYEERQRQIESLASKLDTDDEELKRCLSEIEAIKEIWLPKLRNLVAQINETFSRNFQEMAVAGEVSLDEHDFDFAKFGILIKVKFRQTSQLQVLSAYHQSGGERSVSTILYLVSLQDLTNCPFRVVDEINQGMDAINERKMFQQLVRAASQPNTPQCFLLTPKLLPDLEYSEACSILNIMNGPWIEQPSKAWRHGDPFGIVMGLVGESQC